MDTKTIPIVPLTVPTAIEGDGMGCHSGGSTLLAAARQAGKSEVLDQYAKDYPKNPDAGPHDQPQSMCPAFGSLRVGLRMRRTATILSGSACCVYGLTFTSHFYGAKRSVGYVPFSSETLVTGKLYEDIVEAVHQMADPAKFDAVVVTNLCVPTASGIPLKMLPREIDGVRIVGISNIPALVATEASALYARNLLNFLAPMHDKESGRIVLNREDDMVKPTLVVDSGTVIYKKPN